MTDKIHLRPVTDDDREFLLSAYASGREIELSVVPWNEEQKRVFVEHQLDAQTSYYIKHFPDARHDIIELADSGERVGRVYIDRSEKKISILDITVLSPYRNRGIASAIVDSLTAEAGRSDCQVQVYVETFNPSRSFFTKRGFSVAGTSDVNVRLVWDQPEKS